MNFMTFDYTKDTGKKSRREFFPLTVPNNMYEGIDITELNVEDQAMFIAEMEAAKSDYAAECMRINKKYDIVKNYRRFDPLKMTNVFKESV